MSKVPCVTSVLRLPHIFLQRTLSEAASANVLEVKQELPVKQNFGNVNDQTRIKITLPWWSVKHLIGPQFEHLVQIRKEFRTHLQLSKWGNNFPHSGERILLIKGETENVVRTIHKIFDMMRMMEISESFNNPDDTKSRQNGINVVIPLIFLQDFKGFMRENESHIHKQNLQLDQFHIICEKLQYHKDLKERVLHIGGDEEKVKDALSFVVERLRSGPQVDSNLNYWKFHSKVEPDFDNQPTRIKMTLPWWSVGHIVGAEFKNLLQIRKDCKTNLQLSKWGSVYPGSTEQVLLIEGKTGNVLKTIHKIYDTVRVMEIPESVDNPDAAKTRQNGIILVTPLSFAENLKGIEGENESETRTKFKLDQFKVVTRQPYGTDFKERVIHIGGDEENVKDAVGFLVERLSSGPLVDSNLNYRRINNLTRIKITLPQWSVGPLIGPKYENLIQMEKDCKTYLQFSAKGHFFPGSTERVLLIEGDIENVLKTIHKIYDTVRVMEMSESVDNPDAIKGSQNGISLITPLSFVKDFKAGFERENESPTKKQFKLDQFNVFTRQQYHKNLKERVIRIGGEEKSVKDAVSFVVERLNSGYEVDRNLDYQQYF